MQCTHYYYKSYIVYTVYRYNYLILIKLIIFLFLFVMAIYFKNSLRNLIRQATISYNVSKTFSPDWIKFKLY